MSEKIGVCQRIMNWPHLPMLVFNIALPILIYNIAKEHTSEIMAVFLGGVPPLTKTLVQIFLFGQKDVISMIQIISTAFSVLILMFTTDAKVLFVKDSLTTITMGTLNYLSLYCFHEDMFFQIRRHFTTKTAKEMDEMYTKPHIRRISRFLAVVWGTVMIIEAFFRIGLIVLLSVDTIVYISPFIPILFFWPLGFWSYKYMQTHEDGNGRVYEPLLSTAKDMEKQVDSLA